MKSTSRHTFNSARAPLRHVEFLARDETVSDKPVKKRLIAKEVKVPVASSDSFPLESALKCTKSPTSVRRLPTVAVAYAFVNGVFTCVMSSRTMLLAVVCWPRIGKRLLPLLLPGSEKASWLSNVRQPCVT